MHHMHLALVITMKQICMCETYGSWYSVANGSMI